MNLQSPVLELELYPLVHGDNMVIQVEEAKHNEQIKHYMKKTYEQPVRFSPCSRTDVPSWPLFLTRPSTLSLASFKAGRQSADACALAKLKLQLTLPTSLGGRGSVGAQIPALSRRPSLCAGKPNWASGLGHTSAVKGPCRVRTCPRVVG